MNTSAPSTIHGLFARAALSAPDAVALRWAGRTITYSELDASSSSLAARLQHAGIRQGHIVPLVIPRSPALIACALAVMKLGAAYTALDPAWPAERIMDIAGQTGAPLTISGGGPVAGTVFPVGKELPADDGARVRLPEVSADDVACVFFTSGSTGRPKGVLAPHQGTTRMFGPCAYASFGPGTVTAWAASLQWDALNVEVWGPLTEGGACVVVNEAPLTPSGLRALVGDESLTNIWMSSSLLNLTVDEDPGCFAGLETVLTGGERLSPDHMRRFRGHHPGVRLVNCYGPAEITAFATTHLIGEVADDIPLGRSLNGIDLFILAVAGHEEQRDGEIGEICIGGPRLAAGYLNDPDLTAAKFVTHHVRGRTRRLYRTGDSGYRDADGLLRFGGRMDRQVKIRGQRVEPAEVEQAVAEIPGVRAAAVVPVQGDRLACYYTAGDAISPEQVRESIARRLPAHLVPHHIERVARFPVSANGKLDYAALAKIVPVGPEEAGSPALPADETEKTIAEEIGSVLGRTWTDRDTSFLTVGTSLDAVRLGIRLARRFDKPVPTSMLFRSPSVSGLAAALRARPVADVAAYSADMPVPLHPTPRASWLTDQLAPDGITQHCVMIWRYEGRIPAEAWTEAAAEIHRRHEALRARYTLEDEPVAIVAGGPDTPEVIFLTTGDDATADDFYNVLYRPFDLEAGRVWRTVLAQDPGGGSMLGVAVHHVAFDGWSEHLITADLEKALSAYLRGTVPEFVSPAPRLADVSARRHACVDPPADGPGFWQARLADLGEPMALPRCPGSGRHVARRRIASGDVQRIDKCARGAGGAPTHAGLAALGAAVAGVLGVADLLVGIGVARRSDPLLAEAVGCLLDVLPVRLRTPPGRSQEDHIASAVHEVADALAHQDTPMDDLRRAYGARGSLPFDVIFHAAQRPHPVLNLPAGKAVPIPEYQPSGRELVAEMWPEPDGAVLLVVHQPAGSDPAVAERIAEHWSVALCGYGAAAL